MDMNQQQNDRPQDQNLSTVPQAPRSDRQPVEPPRQEQEPQQNADEQVPDIMATNPTRASPIREPSNNNENHQMDVQQRQQQQPPIHNQVRVPTSTHSQQAFQQPPHQQQSAVERQASPASHNSQQIEPQQTSPQPTDDDINSFIIAIKSGFMEQINAYLEKFGKDIVNRVQPQTRQPSLYFASLMSDEESSLKIMKALVQHGANALFKDQHEQSIIFYACREGHARCVEFLLGRGVPVNEEDLYGQTPIYYAVSQNRLNIMDQFDDKQLLNHKDKLAGQTPLFYAARKGHLEMCKLLIEKGCDPTIHDSHNKLATEYARKAKFPEIADYLLSQVKKVKESNKMVASQQVQQQAVNQSSHNASNHNASNHPQGNASTNNKRGKKKETSAPKQSYKIVYMSASGELRDLTQQEVRNLIKQSSKLESYLANPDTIPQEEINQALSEGWEKVASKVLSVTWKQKGAFWFHEPVDPVKFNIMDYYDIITKPMDLGTVKRKLSHNFYNNANEFVDDIRLVFSNCYRYNGDAHDISKCAKEAEMVFEESVKSLGLLKYMN